MSNYVHGSSLSYRDYLMAQGFERSIKSEISEQTRLLIASNEELQREHISVSRSLSDSVSSGIEQLSSDLNSLSRGVSEGFEQLAWKIDELSQGLVELNSTFQWGFSELLVSVGRVNDSLQELIIIAKTPAQTWAYEQFEIARDAFRKEFYEEAIEYVERAINGYASNTGYKLYIAS